jgi:hypothetical protein
MLATARCLAGPFFIAARRSTTQAVASLSGICRCANDLVTAMIRQCRNESRKDDQMTNPDLTQAALNARDTTSPRRGSGGGAPSAEESHTPLAEMTTAELVLLRVRVIALESLLIAVLSEGSDNQRQAARDMADLILPRSGVTRHALTLPAAQHMDDFIDRANHIRAAQG